jgi:hypothetical protein
MANAGERAQRLEADRWARRWLESRRPAHLVVGARPLDAAEQAKISAAQADQIAAVIRKVLDGLKLPDEQSRRGLDIAVAALRSSTSEDWEPL